MVMPPDASQPQTGELPLQSPMSAPRPELGPRSIEAGPLQRRELFGYVVWGGLGLLVALFECLAAFDATTPWPTLSSTVGNLERDHNWVAILVLGGLVSLAARIVFYPWPNKEAER